MVNNVDLISVIISIDVYINVLRNQNEKYLFQSYNFYIYFISQFNSVFYVDKWHTVIQIKPMHLSISSYAKSGANVYAAYER